MKQGESKSRLWDIDEVARYLHISTGAVYKMTRRKAVDPIPHLKIGGRLRFRPSDIEKWLELMSVSSLEKFAKAKSLARRRAS